MKNQIPKNSLNKKPQIFPETTDQGQVRPKPITKPIRDIKFRTSKDFSPKITHHEDIKRTDQQDMQKKGSFSELQKIYSYLNETPASLKSSKSSFDIKEEKKAGILEPFEKNLLESGFDDSQNRFSQVELQTQHKSEIKSIFNGLIKKQPTVKVEERKIEKFESKAIYSNVERKKTCIMTSKIEVDMIYFDLKYFFKSGVSLMEIICSKNEKNYTIDMNIPKNLPVFDFITKKIEPCLVIKEEMIKFEETSEVFLTSGMFLGEKGSGIVKIVRLYPRWKILVSIDDKSKVFEMADIKNHFSTSVDFTKDLNSLIAFFVLDSKGIQVNLVMNYPLEKIYEGSVENNYLKNPLELIISRVNYINSFSYLLQIKDSSIHPLLIENQVICLKTDRQKVSIAESITFLIKNLTLDINNHLHLIEKSETDKIVENLPIKKFSVFKLKPSESHQKQQFNKSSMFSNLQGLHDGINKVLKPDPPTPILQPLKDYSKDTLLSDMSRVLLKSTSVNQVDEEDRIILRTCLFRDNRIYQVCMSLTEGKILNFYIRRGSESENLNKFSVKVSTLCEKTGLRKDLLIPLGSYVLRNMLIIKEADICYFDFTSTASRPVHAIEKISGLFKAFFARRKISLKLKNLVGKRKIKMDGLIYTCLVYIGDDVLFIRLVRGFEVFEMDVCLSKVVKDGFFTSFEKFFISLVPLGFKLVDKDGKKVLVGLDKYRLG
jgi:hypothetical protein